MRERQTQAIQAGTAREAFQQKEDFEQLLCDAIERYRSVLEEFAEF